METEKPMPEAEDEAGDMKEDMAGAEDPMAIMSSIGDGLAKLAQMPMIPPKYQQAAAGMLDQYTKLVESAMGEMQGGGAKSAMAGQVPMQQGMGGVPMGPQTQN